MEKILDIITSPKFYVPIITVLITILIINILEKMVKKLVNKNAQDINDKKRNTIVVLANNIIKYALILIAVVVILGAWGVNVAGFVAGLGVAGVIAGLALQDALKDIIMGCNIILDNYFVVGDYVTINDFTGEVIEFGLKNTKKKNINDNVLVIANREITNVINYSLKDFCLCVNIDVAYEENTNKVNKVLDEIINKLKEEGKIEKKSVNLGINALDASSVKFLLCVYCNPKNQYAVKRLILSEVKTEFDKRNIKIPYTQIEVHNGK